MTPHLNDMEVTKRKPCPKWGKAGSYDDCEMCPAYNRCMEATIISKEVRKP